MAPIAPLALADGSAPIERVGAQITYVFYKNGVESFVIRPGFSGRIGDFGMLIPFPTPPAIRKVPDDIFGQVAAAIDPPEVVVDLTPRNFGGGAFGGGFGGGSGGSGGSGQGLRLRLRSDEVRVVREEAVGMYEVAVLAAGSAAALSKWMDEHQYRYPRGMDEACNDYIRSRWCFVAVRTRVGRKTGVDPKPGLRNVDATLPAETSFDGHVQAMGFRFHSERLVVPMRLSAFNEGRLRNIVYLLAAQPMRIDSISKKFVVRQLDGSAVFRNLTEPLPLRIIGGDAADIPRWRREALPDERDPAPHNGLAKDLFAGDLLAARRGRLNHRFEDLEKRLVEVSERFRLRGAAVDRVHREAVRRQRDRALGDALAEIDSMAITVIDGDFPREVLAKENLTFRPFQIASAKNTRLHYDAGLGGPGKKPPGLLILGSRQPNDTGIQLADRSDMKPGTATASNSTRRADGTGTLTWRPLVLCCAGLGLVVAARRKRWRASLMASVCLGAMFVIVGISWAGDQLDRRERRDLIRELGNPKKASESAAKLIEHGEESMQPLIDTATVGRQFPKRGWAIICLGQIGGDEARRALTDIVNDNRQPELIRTWAAAARVTMAATVEELTPLVDELSPWAGIDRPIRLRLLELMAADEEPVSLVRQMAVAAKHPRLQAVLAPEIIKRGAAPLVAIAMSADDAATRRQATAYLATIAAGGDNDGVIQAMLDRLAFGADATQVPWHDGPLYLPQLDWQAEQAQSLVTRLLTWYLWCRERRLRDEQRRVHVNLISGEVSRAAGYSWQTRNNARDWLRAWGKVVGAEEIQRLLSEQGLVDRYRDVLDDIENGPQP